MGHNLWPITYPIVPFLIELLFNFDAFDQAGLLTSMMLIVSLVALCKMEILTQPYWLINKALEKVCS